MINVLIVALVTCCVISTVFDSFVNLLNSLVYSIVILPVISDLFQLGVLVEMRLRTKWVPSLFLSLSTVSIV